jgi:hypothetical protein
MSYREWDWMDDSDWDDSVDVRPIEPKYKNPTIIED